MRNLPSLRPTGIDHYKPPVPGFASWCGYLLIMALTVGSWAGPLTLDASGQDIIYEEITGIVPGIPSDKESFTIVAGGYLPDPCHQLVWESDFYTAQGSVIEYQLWGYMVPPPPDTACIQVIMPWTESIVVSPLPAGSYTVELYINGYLKDEMPLEIVTSPAACDANSDDVVNILDSIEMVRLSLGLEPWPSSIYHLDWNLDEYIGLADITRCLNKSLGN